MNLKCKLNIHTWNGCKCRNCDKTREHDWSDKSGKCKNCGENCRHQWSGALCATCGCVNSLIVDQYFSELQEALKEVPLLPEPCKNLIRQQLLKGATVEGVANAFLKEFQKAPKALVDNKLVIKKSVDMLWDQLQKMAVSQGITLLETRCKTKLFELMESGLTAQEAADKFIAELTKNPREYVYVPPVYSSYSSGGYRRESTDKGAIGHDRMNVKTLHKREWENLLELEFNRNNDDRCACELTAENIVEAAL